MARRRQNERAILVEIGFSKIRNQEGKHKIVSENLLFFYRLK